MHIVCISASNIKHAGENSTSLKVCKIICDIIKNNLHIDITTDSIKLVEHNLEPCIGCGKCYEEDKCFIDNEFNNIYNRLCKSDALFIVSAHYAPIPAKLAITLEKMEQLAFLKRFNNESYRSPLFGKPVGIIGHGGGAGEIYKSYRKPVLDSIWNALSYPIEMNIVRIDEENENGITFPVKSVKKSENSIFPVQEYDWADVEERIKPLVSNVVKSLNVSSLDSVVRLDSELPIT